MKRRYRLRDSRSFVQVRKAGRCRRSPELVMCCLVNGRPYCRFGFVVGKRVGNAVTRNRVKRRLRAIFAHHLAHIKSGFDIVVICRPAAADLGFRRLEAGCLHLIRRLRLRSPSEPVPS